MQWSRGGETWQSAPVYLPTHHDGCPDGWTRRPACCRLSPAGPLDRDQMETRVSWDASQSHANQLAKAVGLGRCPPGPVAWERLAWAGGAWAGGLGQWIDPAGGPDGRGSGRVQSVQVRSSRLLGPAGLDGLPGWRARQPHDRECGLDSRFGSINADGGRMFLTHSMPVLLAVCDIAASVCRTRRRRRSGALVQGGHGGAALRPADGVR